ncbi:hypothetical protein HDU97_001590 [Phlyctochytrium planicorne]|nr:hypothetical protein HDU97_001590 [Phlyctochytrium planicorne]
MADILVDVSEQAAVLETALSMRIYSRVVDACEDIELAWAIVDPPPTSSPYLQTSSTDSNTTASANATNPAAMDTDEDSAPNSAAPSASAAQDANAMAIEPFSSSLFATQPLLSHDGRLYTIELAALIISDQLPAARTLTLRVDALWPAHANPSNVNIRQGLPSPLKSQGVGSPHHPSTSDYAAVREVASAVWWNDFDRAYRALHARHGKWDPSFAAVSEDLRAAIQLRAKTLIASAYDSLPLGQARRWLGFIHPDEPAQYHPAAPPAPTYMDVSDPADADVPQHETVASPTATAAPSASSVSFNPLLLTDLQEATTAFAKAAGWDVEQATGPEGGAWILPHASKTVGARSKLALEKKVRDASAYMNAKTASIMRAFNIPEDPAKGIAHLELVSEFVLHLEKDQILAS